MNNENEQTDSEKPEFVTEVDPSTIEYAIQANIELCENGDPLRAMYRFMRLAPGCPFDYAEAVLTKTVQWEVNDEGKLVVFWQK